MSKSPLLKQKIQNVKNNIDITDNIVDIETLDIDTPLLKLELKETIE